MPIGHAFTACSGAFGNLIMRTRHNPMHHCMFYIWHKIWQLCRFSKYIFVTWFSYCKKNLLSALTKLATHKTCLGWVISSLIIFKTFFFSPINVMRCDYQMTDCRILCIQSIHSLLKKVKNCEVAIAPSIYINYRGNQIRGNGMHIHHAYYYQHELLLCTFVCW